MLTSPSTDAAVLLFQHPSRGVRRSDLREVWEDLVRRVAAGKVVTCLVTTDAALRDLNRRFRDKDYATDVLSFPAYGAQAGAGEELGEIAISFDRAAAQAMELGHSTADELRILMLHGLLHLMGMDHETDAGEMRRAEARWRKKLGLPAGLIERAGRERA
ncbi:MAG: rRNA maturation RNase YbeY [Acidobacteriota bacterium]